MSDNDTLFVLAAAYGNVDDAARTGSFRKVSAADRARAGPRGRKLGVKQQLAELRNWRGRLRHALVPVHYLRVPAASDGRTYREWGHHPLGTI